MYRYVPPAVNRLYTLGLQSLITHVQISLAGLFTRGPTEFDYKGLDIPRVGQYTQGLQPLITPVQIPSARIGYVCILSTSRRLYLWMSYMQRRVRNRKNPLPALSRILHIFVGIHLGGLDDRPAHCNSKRERNFPNENFPS
jgi:hypothetical protein